jgi:hypothetical protein
MTQDQGARQLSGYDWANKPEDLEFEVLVESARIARKNDSGAQLPAVISTTINGNKADLEMYPGREKGDPGFAGDANYDAYWTAPNMTPEQYAQWLVLVTVNDKGKKFRDSDQYKLKRFKVLDKQPEPQQQTQAAPAAPTQTTTAVANHDGPFITLSLGGNTYDDRVCDGMLTKALLDLNIQQIQIHQTELNDEEMQDVVVKCYEWARGRHNGTPYGLELHNMDTDDDVEVL